MKALKHSFAMALCVLNLSCHFIYIQVFFSNELEVYNLSPFECKPAHMDVINPIVPSHSKARGMAHGRATTQ